MKIDCSKTNPQKTYLSELLKHYPKVELNDDGTPKWVCICDLGLMSADKCGKDSSCVKCWNHAVDDGLQK